MRILTLMFVVLLGINSGALASGEDSARFDYYSPENIYKFARYLYDNEDYLPAAGEYLRYLHYSGIEQHPPDSVLYMVGMCHRQAGQYLQAGDYFGSITAGSPGSVYYDSAAYQAGYSLFLAQRYEESASRLASPLPDISSVEMSSRMKRLLGLNYLYMKRWQPAFSVYDSLISIAPNDSVSSRFRNYADMGISLPYKSPTVAGIMSTVIPGSGKLYARRLSDGIFSLLVIGLTSWQAYDGFSDDGVRSTKGWIYGTISGILYTGNIYGSIVAVKLHNRQIEERLLLRIGAEVKVYFD